MTLPLNLPLPVMQTKWKAEIDPILSNPLNSISVLSGIKLVSGTNIINHFLGRVMQGWILVDIQEAASIYRPATSPFNSQTLTLVSTAPATIAIGVF